MYLKQKINFILESRAQEKPQRDESEQFRSSHFYNTTKGIGEQTCSIQKKINNYSLFPFFYKMIYLNNKVSKSSLLYVKAIMINV